MTTTPDRFDELVLTASAQTCLPLPCEAVWPVVESVLEHLCSSRVVIAEQPRLLVHAIATDDADDPDGWITWTLVALSPSATRLTVNLSEPTRRHPAARTRPAAVPGDRAVGSTQRPGITPGARLWTRNVLNIPFVAHFHV